MCTRYLTLTASSHSDKTHSILIAFFATLSQCVSLVNCVYTVCMRPVHSILFASSSLFFLQSLHPVTVWFRIRCFGMHNFSFCSCCQTVVYVMYVGAMVSCVVWAYAVVCTYFHIDHSYKTFLAQRHNAQDEWKCRTKGTAHIAKSNKPCNVVRVTTILKVPFAAANK